MKKQEPDSRGKRYTSLPVGELGIVLHFLTARLEDAERSYHRCMLAATHDSTGGMYATACYWKNVISGIKWMRAMAEPSKAGRRKGGKNRPKDEPTTPIGPGLY